MGKSSLVLAGALAMTMFLTARQIDDPVAPKVILAVHGGAGVTAKDKMKPEREQALRADLEKALRAGQAALHKDQGTSLDAVEAAIRVLEDSPLFNAGKGAVFTHEGRNELDASIMEGKGKHAGAVAMVGLIKNPISAARAVMERTPHVLLVGSGADLFAAEAGLDIVEPEYFKTPERWQQLQDALEREKKLKGKSGAADLPSEDRVGTVGAVALDRQGNLSAGTSTGGMNNKRAGRVGDSPIIAAGTYADNATCAVSATGHGELFIRHAVAYDIAARMKYQGLSLQQATREAIAQLPDDCGGVISLDAKGNCVMSFNTEGMYRGWITSDGKIHIAIYDR
jgi:beta-aspartyl-peptidase (threonine type)